MVHFENDYKEGTKAQNEIFPIIEDYFGNNIKQNPNQYDKYDYTNDDAEFEVKTRKNKKTAYSTTMLTCNKVVDTDKEIVFIFNYTDEICWIQYDKELFDTFQKQMFSRAQIAEDEKMHYYIPINLLETIKVK